MASFRHTPPAQKKKWLRSGTRRPPRELSLLRVRLRPGWRHDYVHMGHETWISVQPGHDLMRVILLAGTK
jgi:hypothetical protein